MVTEAEMKDFHDNRLGAVRCTLSHLGSVLCVLTTASRRTLRSGGFDSVYFKRQHSGAQPCIRKRDSQPPLFPTLKW